MTAAFLGRFEIGEGKGSFAEVEEMTVEHHRNASAYVICMEYQVLAAASMNAMT